MATHLEHQLAFDQATIQLDHIVILLPYTDIVNPPSWITDCFTISPGGRHGDNKTEK
jgi:hypothetical protein